MTSDERLRAGPRGPRERVRRQVLDATRELVESGGYAAVTVDALVARSGVSKTTIYRWWDNRAEVALDMMEDGFGLPDEVGDRGSATERIAEYLAAELRYYAGPAGQILRGILADAQLRPALGITMEQRFLGPRRRGLRDLVRSGIDIGEFRADADADLMSSLLLAPLLQSLLTGEPPQSVDLPGRLVAAVAGGLATATCHPSSIRTTRAQPRAAGKSDRAVTGPAGDTVRRPGGSKARSTAVRDEVNIGQLLRVAHQAQGRAIDFEGRYGLTSAQFAVVAAVVSNPGLDQRGISDVAFLARSMLPSVVSRLVDRKLISASRSRQDGRRDHLVPTAAAVALMYEGTPQVLAGNEALLGRLPVEVRASFLEALEAVGIAARTEPPRWHRVPSPDGVRPALEIPWGLGRLLRAASQRYGRIWPESITSVTMLQWLTLLEVDTQDEVDQSALCASIHLDKATASALLSLLARRRLVVRVADDADRRRRLLHLTDEGRRQLAVVNSAVPEVNRAFLAPLDDESTKVLVHGLGLLGE